MFKNGKYTEISKRYRMGGKKNTLTLISKLGNEYYFLVENYLELWF
jgi:hypothetical protein